VDDEDKEFIAVGPDVLDPSRDRFVVTWQRSGVIFASTSIDGVTWESPVIVGGMDGATSGHVPAPRPSPTGHSIDAIPAVGPNGEIYVVWEDYSQTGSTKVVYDVSYDGGKTWGGHWDQHVFFDHDSFVLESDDKYVLDQVASLLLADPTLVITLAGHTDVTGNAPYNVQLGVDRADAVADYLESKGVDRSRMTELSLGENQVAFQTPPGSDGKIEGNRRVEIGFDRVIYTSNVNPFNDPFNGGVGLDGSDDNYEIPAQPERGILTALSIDVDRSGGDHNGRVYISFTDQADRDGSPDAANPTDHHNTDVFLIATDNDGREWNALAGEVVKINKDTGTNSQFFSSIDVDQKTGDVGVGWYDARNDTDADPNKAIEFFAAYSKDGGSTWSDGVKVSDGASDFSAVDNTHLGEYAGVAFVDGTIYSAWVDNSNSTKDNPDKAGTFSDVYYDRVAIGGNKADDDTGAVAAPRGDSIGVGIAVAVNVADVLAEARIGNAKVTADGVNLQAVMASAGGDSVHKFGADAKSGASGADTGVAGSLAINVGMSEAVAQVSSNATLTITDKGDVTLSAENFAQNDVRATAAQSKAGKVGVGASIGLNIGETDTHA